MKKILLIGLLTACVSCNLSEEKKETQKSLAYESTEIQTNLQQSMERGSEVYADFCMRCHMSEGQGVDKNFPPLAGSDFLMNKRTESIKAVKFGQSGVITVNGQTYNSVMAPMGLSNQEVADVMNYIMNSWGNEQKKIVTPTEVVTVEK